MDKRIFLFLIVLVAFTVEAKKKILKKKLNQLKGKETKMVFQKIKLLLCRPTILTSSKVLKSSKYC